MKIPHGPDSGQVNGFRCFRKLLPDTANDRFQVCLGQAAAIMSGIDAVKGQCREFFQPFAVLLQRNGGRQAVKKPPGAGVAGE